MKKSFSITLITLVLIVAMISSLTACVMGDSISTTTATTTTTGNIGDDNPESDTHVCVFDDWEIVKLATNIEDGLRERKCECGNIEQEVIEASGKEYAIHYMNLKSAAYPSENGYNSAEGLLNLPVPEAEGYVFVGWYTKSIGGEIIDYIPKGSNTEYVLFAHWELISYNITYRNAPNNTNVTTYTIEDNLMLKSPEWSGLEFSHWSDEKGNIYKPYYDVTELPKSMTGDLILTANWKVLRNIVTAPTEGNKLVTAYSPQEGVLYFIFELGTIEHVVLDSINPNIGTYYKNDGEPLSLTLSQTVSVSEETIKSVSNTVSKSVSNTKTFSNANNWANENSFSEKSGISYGAGFDAGFVSGHVDVSYEVESSSGSSYGHSNSTDVSSGSSSGTSNTISSSMSYKKELTSQITETKTIPADLPKGYYAYVHAGNIRVWGVVTYEIASGNYYIDTYSRLDNMHSMTMYYPDVNQLNNPSVEGLDFNIPEEKILSYVEEWKSTNGVPKESGIHYYAEFPSGFDRSNELYSKYSNDALESGINGNRRIVVEETKFYTYIYWHWSAYRKAPYNRYIDKNKGGILPSGAAANYFAAFESNQNYGHTDKLGNTERSDIFYCNRGGDTDGSWWWYQIPVYVQTYTVYELSE